jgi:hypothetical protein
VAANGLRQQRGEGLDPGEHGASGAVDTALGQSSRDLGGREAAAAVPMDGPDDDGARPTEAGEGRAVRPVQAWAQARQR